MKLYLITQSKNNGYDTFDSAVVVAEDENDARLIHPSYGYDGETADKWDSENNTWGRVCFWGDFGTSTWTSPEFVDVEYLGEAAPGSIRGCVLSSFNAG